MCRTCKRNKFSESFENVEATNFTSKSKNQFLLIILIACFYIQIENVKETLFLIVSGIALGIISNVSIYEI